MTLVTLQDVLQPALAQRYAVAGLVTQGWEDMRAFVQAAEAEQCPVILQAGPGCRAHTPLPVLSSMLLELASSASVPVVVHLDHGYDREECMQALDCGFSSVMYDGSSRPLAQNIDETAEIAELAHSAGASCEGEIGFVGYAQGAASRSTSPEDAQAFASQTGIDAMAISVGNVHLQQRQHSNLDLDAIAAIEAVTSIPLVIHGGSGVSDNLRAQLAVETAVCKFNIGTELRKVFGAALKHKLDDETDCFDRIELLTSAELALKEAARRVIRTVSRPEHRDTRFKM